MVYENKSLGRFILDGLPPAPRGLPQIEVTFDIDANGILHVSAKDKATGREQRIQIQSSSGLTQDEIDRMVREAQLHAADDAHKREEAELKNRADNLAYQAEKTLTEAGDRVPSDLKLEIENHVQSIRRGLESSDTASVRSASEALEAALQRLGEAVYANTGSPTGGAGGGQSGSGATGGGDTVEGEFREV
jgi:molecular chaperone DnaK